MLDFTLLVLLLVRAALCSRKRCTHTASACRMLRMASGRCRLQLRLDPPNCCRISGAAVGGPGLLREAGHRAGHRPGVQDHRGGAEARRVVQERARLRVRQRGALPALSSVCSRRGAGRAPRRRTRHTTSAAMSCGSSPWPAPAAPAAAKATQQPPPSWPRAGHQRARSSRTLLSGRDGRR